VAARFFPFALLRVFPLLARVLALLRAKVFLGAPRVSRVCLRFFAGASVR
jgi:hypothetical protein